MHTDERNLFPRLVPGEPEPNEDARAPGVLTPLYRWRERRRRKQEAADQARQVAWETAQRLEALHEAVWQDWTDMVQQTRAQVRQSRPAPDERRPS